MKEDTVREKMSKLQGNAKTETNNSRKTRLNPKMTIYHRFHVTCISESYIEIKIKLNVYFQTYLWCHFFIKPFQDHKEV